MGYIQDLRRRVGNQPLIMVGAGVLIFNRQNELLLLRRTDNGCWGIPGGAMEPGERIEETACRETREETGLEVGDLLLFNIFSGPELYYRYPNGAEVFNVSVVYIAKEARGKLEIDPAEHIEMGYFSLDELPEELSPPVRPVLASYRKSCLRAVR